MSQQTIECANPPCNCEVVAPIDNAETFCSDYCENAGENEETEICACGHPPCDVE